MITNPNRFIRGLSDISDIVDDNCCDSPQVIESPSQNPQVVSAPSPSVGGAKLSSSNFGEVEVTLSQDGAQILSLPDSNPLGYALYINGFRQSKSAYTVSVNAVILPGSLDLFTGDVVTFSYMKA